MNIKIGILNVPKHGNKHDLIYFVTVDQFSEILTRYSVTHRVIIGGDMNEDLTSGVTEKILQNDNWRQGN